MSKYFDEFFQLILLTIFNFSEDFFLTYNLFSILRALGLEHLRSCLLLKAISKNHSLIANDS